MALTLISVPIGNMGDITLRALESLRKAELFIGEERKPMFRLLKELGIETPKHYELLNEHSDIKQVKELATLCGQKETVLVTDCGTPGFSDPGADLVKECRAQGVSVTANPGASSLTTFLSLCGVQLKSFNFRGFLPRETSERLQYLKKLASVKEPTIIMDTPYRLRKTLEQCEQCLGNTRLILGMNLTKADEKVIEGTAKRLLQTYGGEKKEFLLLVVPGTF